MFRHPGHVNAVAVTPDGTRVVTGAEDGAVRVVNHGIRDLLVTRTAGPRLDEWRAVRDRLDPDGVLTSDMDRRLDLTGHRR